MPVNTIMGLFAKSPIKPLQEHVVCVNECCSHLIPFFETCAKGDWEEANNIRENISRLEREADVLKREDPSQTSTWPFHAGRSYRHA